MAVDLAHFAVTCAVLGLCWRHMALATEMLALVALVRFSLRPRRRELGWFAFGFVFASLAEIVQVWAGVYRYAQPCPLVIPYYNFFLWGVVLCLASSLLGALERRAPLSSTLTGLAVDGGLYLAVTTLLCLRADDSRLVAAIFTAVLGLRLAFFYQKGDGLFLLLGILIGPLTEAWLVGLGMYRFADPAIYRLLPLWHPIYWGIIVLFLRRLAAARLPRRLPIV